MSKILFSTISGLPYPDLLPCFYEGFINALLREGNDVMLMITNKFHTNPWITNQPGNNINRHAVLQEVKAFNPDFIITCNNSLFAGIADVVDCPILVWAMDSPPLFCDQNTLKRDIGRYQFICPTTEFYPSLISHFRATNSQMHLIAYASDFVAEQLEQSIPISFIGTRFLPTPEIKEVFYHDMQEESVRNDLKKFLCAFEKDVLLSPDTLLDSLSKTSQKILKKIPHVTLLNLLSSNIRSQTLYHIHDLGLHLYGSKAWYDFFDFSLPFAFCFQDKSVCTVAENQNLYNTSKIAINITHVQAKNTFGWRVRDIMATNACLISDYRKDLVTLFSKYVDIPIFNNPFEARSLCKKLLKDDIWRKEIVAGSQLAIEENHRFNHRLIELENTFGFDLHPSKTQGTFKQIHAKDFQELSNGESSRIFQQWTSYAFAYKVFKRILPYSVKARLKGRINIPSPLTHFQKSALAIDTHTSIKKKFVMNFRQRYRNTYLHKIFKIIFCRE